jgi:acetyl-CoA carboxylase carboxyl transferase subunit alpha
MDTRQALDFERPLVELENRIAELRQVGGPSLDLEIRRLERRARQLQREIFSELSPWQKVLLSRHPLRPFTLDYVRFLVEDFVELHGDRAFRDDGAVVGGLGRMKGRAVMLLGHQKGRGTKENLSRNFGMPRPEGYRKARRLMELAARLGLPIVTFIDTPGAYPGIDAEERGQAEAIAKNLEVMARLPVPIVSVVIGEGGSGGALALGVADRILMLEYAVYSVISPEGCASILWKDQAQVETAAREMKMTAADLYDLGVADQVIAEPAGGAHRDPEQAAALVGEAVSAALDELSELDDEARLERRYEKFRKMGAFAERNGSPRRAP